MPFRQKGQIEGRTEGDGAPQWSREWSRKLPQFATYIVGGKARPGFCIRAMGSAPDAKLIRDLRLLAYVR